jgi:hypothetical protein
VGIARSNSDADDHHRFGVCDELREASPLVFDKAGAGGGSLFRLEIAHHRGKSVVSDTPGELSSVPRDRDRAGGRYIGA